MHATDVSEAQDLLTFVDASPTPFHACAHVAERLTALGFRRLDELEAWPAGSARAGAFFVARGGSLVAWVAPEADERPRGFRVVGAHTDSPNLRIKPKPDLTRGGFRQLAVEVYGGALWNSWLDRDLGLAGRVFLRGAGTPVERLFRIDRPILRIPQLAIHLNREVNTDGLKLNPQQHLNPLFAIEEKGERGFRELLGEALSLDPATILAWDAMAHDVQPSSLAGVREEFLSAPRLDNLASCHAATCALLARSARKPVQGHVAVIALFDHEEVGSASARGAQSPLLKDVLERIALGRGGGRENFLRAIADSLCVSADMAHGTHPNYPEKHEPGHAIRLNAGPVIKVNTNLRYASEGETEAVFQLCCEKAGVPFQKFVNRSDLACGTTIGPLTAANLGMRTVDVGNPMLAMHSARELAGAKDPALMIRALTEFLE